MSYLHTRYRRSSRPRRKLGRGPAMGDDFDFSKWFSQTFLGGKPIPSGGDPELQKCLAQADNKTAPMDARTDDLQKNWNPTGIYSPSDLKKVISATNDLLQASRVNVIQALADDAAGGAAIDILSHPTDIFQSPSDFAEGPNYTTLKQEVDDIDKQLAQYQSYLQSYNEAVSGGGDSINAPNLKHWVLKSMDTASNSQHAITLVSCMRPWWLSAILKVATALEAVWNAAKSVAGKIAEVAGKVVDAVEGGLDAIAWLEKYGPIAVVGLLGLWIVTRSRKSKPKGA